MSESKQCAALSSGAERCRKRDTKLMSYHGDGEIYDSNGPTPQWVVVPLCSEHRKWMEKSFNAWDLKREPK